MAAQASQAELNKFVKVVDEFKAKYAKLILPETQREVFATNNQAMIADYQNAIRRGATLNSTINNLVGAWDAFKRGYSAVTDRTSMVIGDAIDEIRSWFGYKPAGGMGNVPPIFGEDILSAQEPFDKDAHLYGTPYSQLGAVQVGAPVAAIAIAGVVASAYILINMMDKIFVNLQANRIQRENPNISRGDALAQGKQGVTQMFGGLGLSMPMIAAGALALYFILGSKK